MNIIITGTKGYLSCKIAEYLRNEGHTVCQVSIRNEDFVISNLNTTDIVIHVAGIVPKDNISDNDFFRINADKTELLIDKCNREGSPLFIYISTMAIYGNQLRSLTDSPIKLNTESKTPSSYGSSKLKAENIIIENYNHNWVILRVPSLYDNFKQEYFKGYLSVLKKYPIIPIVGKCCTKKSILSIDNLCHLLGDIASDTEKFKGRILLPADANTPTTTDILKKISSDLHMKNIFMKIPYALGKLIMKFLPSFSYFMTNCYYDENEKLSITYKDMNDYHIGDNIN